MPDNILKHYTLDCWDGWKIFSKKYIQDDNCTGRVETKKMKIDINHCMCSFDTKQNVTVLQEQRYKRKKAL